MAWTSTATADEAVRAAVARVRSEALSVGIEEGVLAPPYDPKALAPVLGVSEIRAVDLGYAGNVDRIGDKIVIEYDRYAGSAGRTRFTIAHELGHLLVARATGSLRKTRGRAPTSEVELLCNAIAAEMLLPADDIKKYWDAVPVADRHSATLRILELTKLFNVSVEQAARRFIERCDQSVGVILARTNQPTWDWAHGQLPVEDVHRSLRSFLEHRMEEEADGAQARSGVATVSIRMSSTPADWVRLSTGSYLIALHLFTPRPRRPARHRRERRSKK